MVCWVIKTFFNITTAGLVCWHAWLETHYYFFTVITVSVGQWARESPIELDKHQPSAQPPQEEPVGWDGVSPVRHTLGLQPQQQGAFSGPAGLPAGACAAPTWMQRHHLSPPWTVLRGRSPDCTLSQRSGRWRDWGGELLCGPINTRGCQISCYSQQYVWTVEALFKIESLGFKLWKLWKT